MPPPRGPCWGQDVNVAPKRPGHQRHHCPTRCVMGVQSPDPGRLMSSLSPRYDEGSGGSGDESRDEAQKREWNLFYQKQMRLRKVKGVGFTCSGWPLLTPSQPLSGAGLGAVLLWGRMAHRTSCHLPGQRSQDRGIRTPRSVQKCTLGWSQGVGGGCLFGGSGMPESRK